MKPIFLLAAAFTLLALPAMAQSPPATANAAAVYDIGVTVDAAKANGSPWDGVPGLRNSKANLNNAPDIAVCLVQAQSKPNCLWRPDGRRLFSNCQNAITCKFDKVALPLPIGLVFVDIDIRNHDVIDTVILTGNEDSKAHAEIADSLRAAMSILTPNRSEDTKEHLVRDAKLIPLQDCVGKPCRLTQSEFRLDRK